MENKKDKRLIKIIVSIIIILILLLILVIARLRNMTVQEDKELDRIKSYTTIDDFKTVEEVAKYLECDYIKQEKSKVENYNWDFYIKIKVLPYTDNNSNEGFYDKLISYSAKVLNFDNFRIVDKENNNIIEVICNKEKEAIKTIIINGESNYFAKRDSEIQMNDFKQVKETNLTIQSDILTKLISNNWRLKESDIGTKESTFNSYDIYFDEGIEIRKIDNKVFNIVFTDKYKPNIVNNITTSSSKESIIKILGEPTLKDDYTDVIGYKGKGICIFFNTTNKQISIYEDAKYPKNDNIYEIYKKYKEENKTIKELINLLKDKWKDYDYYKETNNYITLIYSLRGIKIEYNAGTQNGINIYNNYSGIIYDNIKFEDVKDRMNDIPEDIFINNKNLLFIQEVNRANYVESAKYYGKVERDRNKRDNDILSKLFVELKQEMQDGSSSVRFVSLDGKNANSELKEYINSGLWINDRFYIYSVKQKGIYIYDAIQRKYVTIASGNNEDYEIKEYVNGILKYDEKTIKLNL